MVLSSDVVLLADVDEEDDEDDDEVDAEVVFVDEAFEEDEDDEEDELLEPELELSSEPSRLKMTILALLPGGTVTTQKFAFPAPVDLRELPTPFRPSVEGLIPQGRPTQPPPSHSIFIPKVGRVSFHLEVDSNLIGFHPSVTNVLPSPTVFAPATKFAQFPRFLDPSPQRQA